MIEAVPEHVVASVKLASLLVLALHHSLLHAQQAVVHAQMHCTYVPCKVVCLQVEVHCHWRNDRTIEWCKNEGIHVTAYAPLSSPQTMSLEKKDVPNLLKVLCRNCAVLYKRTVG